MKVEGLRPDLDGQAFGRTNRIGGLVGALEDEKIRRGFGVALDFERDARRQKPVKRNRVLDGVGFQMAQSLLISRFVGSRKMGSAACQYDESQAKANAADDDPCQMIGRCGPPYLNKILEKPERSFPHFRWLGGLLKPSSEKEHWQSFHVSLQMRGGRFESFDRVDEGQQQVAKLEFHFAGDGVGKVSKISEELSGTIGVKGRLPEKIPVGGFRGGCLLIKIGEQLKNRVVGRQARPGEPRSAFRAQGFG
jgi:hypothetical protein